MNRSFARLVCVSLAAIGLVSCSSFNNQGGMASNGAEPMMAQGETTSNETVGSGSMDSIDRNKLSHALDKSIGRETTWKNGATGVTYTVVPTRKTTVGSNTLCREYRVTKAVGSNTSESSSVACVGSDGSWHPA
jgi:surface antigen